MTRSSRLVFIAALVLPAIALAADAGGPVLDFRTGVPAKLVGTTMGMARAFLPLSIIVALLIEAFGSSPTRPKDYGGVVTRALIVVALLSVYGKLVGTVVATTTSIADRIAPKSIYEDFGRHNIKAMEELTKASAAEKGEDTGILGLPSSAAVVKGYVGGALFDGLVLVCVALGQGLHWAFQQLTRIMLALLYVLGPLAIVFHVPAPSDVARRWFRTFVTICTWPIFSALLLAFAAQLLLRTDSAAVFGEYATAFSALATTILMVVMCLAVPLLASALVGGSLKNVPMASLAAAGLGAAALVRGANAMASTTNAHGVGAGAVDAAVKSGARDAAATSDVGSVTSVPPQVAPTPRVAVDSGGGAAAAVDFGDAATVASSGHRGGAQASGMPADLRVPIAAAQPPPPPVEAMDKTVAGGKGRQKGRGSFAGAWKLPPVGQAVVVPPQSGDRPQFKEPLMDMPRGFNAANWSDVGSAGPGDKTK